MISPAQFLEMQARVQKQQPRLTDEPPVERENVLHEQILDWCQAQWPRWKVLHARMDKRSTIAVGAHDLTVFGPYPLVMCVECKARDEKLRKEQQIWAAELRMLGWVVYVVRSVSDFHLAMEKAGFAKNHVKTGEK